MLAESALGRTYGFLRNPRGRGFRPLHPDAGDAGLGLAPDPIGGRAGALADPPRTRLGSMAIFSLSHSAIGRTTHDPGTAGAHARYITRRRAATAVLSARLPAAAPGRADAARAWLDAEEAAERKNGRVVDKVMVALPIELDAERQAALVRAFAEEATAGRAPWLAGLHLDKRNPHAHIVIRDKDPATGRRVVQLSERGSTDKLRALWQRHANAALAAAGVGARIDRRSLADQGIERTPEIHVGARPAAMEARGVRPVSRDRCDRRGREIRWPTIDEGRTRAERRAEIVEANLAVAETRRGAALAETWDVCARQIAADRLEREAEASRALECAWPAMPDEALEPGRAGAWEACAEQIATGSLPSRTNDVVAEMTDGQAGRLGELAGSARSAEWAARRAGAAYRERRERIREHVGILRRAFDGAFRARDSYGEQLKQLVIYIGEKIGRIIGRSIDTKNNVISKEPYIER